ncbi:MAG: sulfatase [Acidobacteriota bacterium]
MIQRTIERLRNDRRGAGVLSGRAAATALLLAILSSAAACGGAPAPPEPQRTPNIVLVTIDTLRADHLEAYGYPRATAPFLARLASSGVRFARGISQAPWTLPAMASLHSSLLPSQHGAIEAETALPEAAETLAERLHAAGYATVAVVSHEFVSAKHGFAQGFDVFDESNVLGHEAVTSRDLTMTALARLGEVQQPFFLWVHYFDPHFTYVRHPEFGFADGYTGALPDQITSGRLVGEERRAEPMADYDLDYVKAVYDEEIAYTDEWIATLWQGIADRYGDDAVIFVTADHGEYFLERGRFFHGKDVYRELVDVPLIIAGAIDEGLRGTVVEPAVATLSIPRTVLGVLGLPGDDFGGVDLLEVARGADPPPVIAEGSYAFGSDARTEGVQYRGFKLIHRLDDDGYELYDLSTDPWERDDVFADFGAGSEVVERLMQSLHWFRDQPRLEPQPVGLTPEALERLRQLGYIR